MTFSTRLLLLLGYGAVLAQSQTLMLSACSRIGNEQYCLDNTGEEYELVAEGAETSEAGEGHEHESTESHEGQNCHFHAGVEHCVGAGESESGGTRSCERTDRTYNIPLRIGLLFVIFITSAIAVFAPILMGSYLQNNAVNFCLMILKQFGTGVMVSTAFIHLLTHATLMLTNECIDWPVEYEGTATAIMMAGIFLAFLTEYLGARFLFWRNDKHAPAGGSNSSVGSRDHDPEAGGDSLESGGGGGGGKTAPTNTLTTIAGCGNELMTHVHPGQEKLAVTVMETGIIFHSLLIGLTLVVAGDSFFLTLFVVIIFHQAFEGIALGARIAELPSSSSSTPYILPPNTHPVSLTTKLTMGALFALVTPVGMAIGIGVLGEFNGNDPATLVAIGTLDAVRKQPNHEILV
ncbi:putative zinc iron transporter [Diplodia seriata]|uniref:Putative zinc iron transporter n=1 Tax=Diplodia seriata TaxID=420778 RepID=A0A0G2GL40_9PEZI|nr:putative zinc iron transporter [Diplodia seriata]